MASKKRPTKKAAESGKKAPAKRPVKKSSTTVTPGRSARQSKDAKGRTREKAPAQQAKKRPAKKAPYRDKSGKFARRPAPARRAPKQPAKRSRKAPTPAPAPRKARRAPTAPPAPKKAPRGKQARRRAPEKAPAPKVAPKPRKQAEPAKPAKQAKPRKPRATRAEKEARLLARLHRTKDHAKRRELAEQLVDLLGGGKGAKPGRESKRKGKRPRQKPPAESPYRRPATLHVPDVKKIKRVRRSRSRVKFDGGELERISRPKKMKSGGWFERYERETAGKWFSKSGRTVPMGELRGRTLYERIRDDILKFPPDVRKKLVMRIRSGAIAGTINPATGEKYGRAGILVAVPTDDREALVSIPGLLYTAGVRESPKSMGEGATPEIDITFFVEGD